MVVVTADQGSWDKGQNPPSLRMSLEKRTSPRPSCSLEGLSVGTGRRWRGTCQAVSISRDGMFHSHARAGATLLTPQACGLGILFLSASISQLPCLTGSVGPILGMDKQGSEGSKVTAKSKVTQVRRWRGKDSNRETPFP